MKSFFCFILLVASSLAQSSDQVHDELRNFRTQMIEAVNQRDIAKIQTLLHPKVTINWLNGEVSTGPESVKAYFDKMMTGPNPIVATISINPVAADLSLLHANDTVATSFGESNDSYKLTSGLEFNVTSKWTATLVKENGQWLLSSFHSSVNLFDNPLLNKAKSMSYVFGVLGLLLGSLATGFFFWRKQKVA